MNGLRATGMFAAPLQSARQVHLYTPGQWRQPAASAVKTTGIGVVEIGHRRSEEWGLRMLAHLLEQRWSELRAVVPYGHGSIIGAG